MWKSWSEHHGYGKNKILIFQCIEVPVVQRIVSCCFSFLGGCQLDVGVDADVALIVLFVSNCVVSYFDVRLISCAAKSLKIQTF